MSMVIDEILHITVEVVEEAHIVHGGVEKGYSHRYALYSYGEDGLELISLRIGEDLDAEVTGPSCHLHRGSSGRPHCQSRDLHSRSHPPGEEFVKLILGERKHSATQQQQTRT